MGEKRYPSINGKPLSTMIALIRPSFFNFLIYEKIFKILESGGQNKNKKKNPKIVQLIKK